MSISWRLPLKKTTRKQETNFIFKKVVQWSAEEGLGIPNFEERLKGITTKRRSYTDMGDKLASSQKRQTKLQPNQKEKAFCFK